MLENIVAKTSEIIAYIEPYKIDIVLIILVATFTIILALGEDVKNKYYQKKYLLTCYLLLYVLTNIFGASIVWISFVFIVFILPLSTLNLSYSNNKNNFLEQELSAIQYWIYHTLYWIFIVEMYILFLCIVIISFTPNVYIKTLIILVFSIFHLYRNSKDLLGVQSFSNTRDRIVKQMNEFNKQFYSIEEEDKKIIVYELLGFIIYAEDRGYFERKGPNINLKILFEQKYGVPFNIFNLIKKFKYIVHENSSDQPDNGKKINKATRIINVLKLAYRRYFRGYSTIEMQHVRINVMNPNSFDYVIRRKIFVEGIYTYFYFCSWKRFILRMKGKDYNSEDIITYIKVITLKSYYMDKAILDNPIDYDDLINKFSSRLGTKDYADLYDLFEISENDYVEKILDNFEIANTVYNLH